MHERPSILLHAARGLALASRDFAALGVLHPGLWAWRMEEAFQATRRFESSLRSRAQGQPAAAFAQGDTPWTVLMEIAAWLHLSPKTTFVDVGAGNGLAAAVLSTVSGSRGYAVEPLGPLRRRAAAGCAALRVPVTAVERLEEVPIAQCSAAYGAWTCVDAPARAHLLEQLRKMPVGSHLVTVTHPPEHEQFAPVAHVTRMFPWGRSDVFVARRA